MAPRYGYPRGSFSEEMEYHLHGRLFCRGGCDRHPDVTPAIAEQLRAERHAAPPEVREAAEVVELLGRQPHDRDGKTPSLAWGPLIMRNYWPEPPGAVPWPLHWTDRGYLIGPAPGRRGHLPTTPATSLEWSGRRRERPCWSCRWGPRRWRRRRHWACLPAPAAALDLREGVDPWGRPWCLCEESGARHVHTPSGAIVIYQPEP